MKYSALLDFCALLCATEADDTSLAERHVMSDGYIAKAWIKVMEAIVKEEDLDYRAYLESLIDQQKPMKRLLN